MKYIGIGFVFIAAIVLLALVFTFPLMWFINWLFSPVLLLFIFGTAKLGFWQTFALSVITSMLFKSSTVSSSK